MTGPFNGMLAIAFMLPTVGWAACTVESGPRTTALLELYTSEGCSSCPPADKRLSEFPSGEFGLNRVVPISLHVDYWDSLGWKEPFAQPQFSERQGWLVRANGHRTVFTPHFFVSGKEVNDRRGDLVAELKRVTATPTRASIRVHAEPAGAHAMSVEASATATTPAGPLALFVAVTESGLRSSVLAGENRGVTLLHDHVVREWHGPISLDRGRVDFKQIIAAKSGWNSTQLGVVSFVQNLRTGQVLQAIGAQQCLAR
jgi:hypothetical protein